MTAAEPEISVDTVFAALGVGVSLGCLLATVTAFTAGDALGSALEAAAADVRAHADGNTAPVPEIVLTRRAYKACGKDPSRYRPASEALARRVLKGETPPRVNPIVDVNTLVSLRTGLACGVYARTTLQPPFRLRLGTAEDIYEGIGRGMLNVAHLPVVADAHGPFGSPTSDTVRSAVGPETREVLMVIYAFDTSAEAALADARYAFEAHLGATSLVSAVITG